VKFVKNRTRVSRLTRHPKSAVFTFEASTLPENIPYHWNTSDEGPQGHGHMERLALIRANLERIEVGYIQATERDITNPVVILLDLRDRGGRLLADQVTGARQSLQAIERSLQDDTIPVTQWTTSKLDACRLIRQIAPRTGDALVEAGLPGHFPVVVVSECGVRTEFVAVP
jgi:hypothetical protein